MRVVDLFCGAGGMSEGFRQAGFDVMLGIDNDPQALETFRRNHPGSEAWEEDIEKVDEIPDCDVVIGGPPCPDFSIANKKRDPKAGMELVYEFLRLKDTADPDWWIMENVPQITNHISRKDFPVIKILNCVEYGVPQRRKRCFAGAYPTPRPTHVDSKEPQRTLDGRTLKPHVTVWEAIWDLLLTPTEGEWNGLPEYVKERFRSEDYEISPSGQENIRIIGEDEPSPTLVKNVGNNPHQWLIPDHEAFNNLGCSDLDHAKRGVERDEPAPTVHPHMRTSQHIRVPDHDPQLGATLKEYEEKGSRYGSQKPIDLEAPSPVLTTEIERNVKFPHHYLLEYPGSTVDSSGYLYEKGHHKTQTEARVRRLTVRECARLQSFPDDFLFCGSKTSKYRQVGNAVPPLMAYRIAEAIKDGRHR